MPPIAPDILAWLAARRERLANTNDVPRFKANAIDKDCPSEAEIQSDAIGSNMKRFKAALSGLKIVKFTEPYSGIPPKANDLLTLLDAEIYDNRFCAWKIEPDTRENILFNITVFQIRRSSLSFPKDGLVFPIYKDFFSEEEAIRLATHLVHILSRWPHEVSENMSPALKMQLVVMSRKMAYPAAKEYFNPVMWDKHAGGYYIKIITVNPQTGNLDTLTRNILPKLITNLNVPDVPENCVFGPGPGYTPSTTSTPWPTVPPEDQPRHEAAVKVCKLVAWKLNGKIITPSDARRLVGFYIEQYGKFQKKGNGPYGGNPLTYNIVDRYTRRIGLQPSNAVINDLSKRPPNVYIRSLLKSRLIPVLDAYTQEWLNTGDILVAYEALAKAADNVNDEIAAGEPPALASQCQCTATMKTTELHPCGNCFQSTICETLRYDIDNVRVCQDCAQKQPPMSTPESIIRRGLHKRIRQECRLLGVDFDEPENRAILDAAWTDVKRSLPQGNKWIDSYSNVPRELVSEPLGQSAYQRHYLLPAIEAFFPYGSANGQWRSHSVGNIGVTALYINFMKATHLPASLAIIKKYRSSQRLSSDEDTIVAEMDNITKIRLQTPYVVKKRFEQAFDPKVLESDRRQCKTATPKKPETVKLTYVKTVKRPIWTPPGAARIDAIVKSIEERFGCLVARGNDGCAYPFHPKTIPSDWCWHTCWELFGKRVRSMESWCNGKWIQVDTIETIYLECVWQWCNPKCKEFLGLPLSVYFRHPLRFAIAHRIHGQQLRSGWTRPDPQSIDDRDEALNNMDVETCTSNYARSNFSEEVYGDILKDFDLVEVPSSLYDPSAGIGGSYDEQESFVVGDDVGEEEFGGDEVD